MLPQALARTQLPERVSGPSGHSSRGHFADTLPPSLLPPQDRPAHAALGDVQGPHRSGEGDAIGLSKANLNAPLRVWCRPREAPGASWRSRRRVRRRRHPHLASVIQGLICSVSPVFRQWSENFRYLYSASTGIFAHRAGVTAPRAKPRRNLPHTLAGEQPPCSRTQSNERIPARRACELSTVAAWIME